MYVLTAVAAKQAAFEEANKLQNQFLSLNDDDIEFLDEVQAKKRQEEQRQKQEMEEGLKAFRDRQRGEEVERKDEDEGNEWTVGRKRKRGKERDVKVKRVEKETEEVKDEKTDDKKEEIKEKAEEKKEQLKKPALGLVDYGSDSDDD